MGNITKLNNILCYDINAIDGTVASDIVKWDANEFCVSPTPTPTPTPTQSPSNVTPTPTPTITPTPTPSAVCDPTCCLAELCFSDRDCSAACQCNIQDFWYLHLPCQLDPCELGYADGIFTEDTCTDPAKEGYYMQGGECYYWDGISSLTYNGPC